TGVNSGTAAGIANWTTIENLVGTAGADTFVLAGGSIQTIDGLGGNDLLDVSGAAPDVTVTLTGTGSVDGFAGHSASAGVGSFDNINAIEAGGGDDTLVADIDAGGAFVVKPGSDTYTSGGNQLVFNGFENLTGGDGDDTFTLNESLPGVASGGGGDDSFVVNVANAGTLSGDAGSDTFTFNAGQSGPVSGGLGDDTFIVNAGNITGVLDGGAGDDRFILEGGKVSGGIEGGNGADTVDFNGSTVAGAVNTGAGNDVLNFNSGNLGGAHINAGAGDDTYDFAP